MRDVHDFSSLDPFEQIGHFFLDIDNELRLFQLMGEPCVLPFQFGDTTDMGIGSFARQVLSFWE